MESRNRQLLMSFFAVVLAIVVLLVIEVILVAVMLSQGYHLSTIKISTQKQQLSNNDESPNENNAGRGGFLRNMNEPRHSTAQPDLDNSTLILTPTTRHSVDASTTLLPNSLTVLTGMHNSTYGAFTGTEKPVLLSDKPTHSNEPLTAMQQEKTGPDSRVRMSTDFIASARPEAEQPPTVTIDGTVPGTDIATHSITSDIEYESDEMFSTESMLDTTVYSADKESVTDRSLIRDVTTPRSEMDVSSQSTSLDDGVTSQELITEQNMVIETEQATTEDIDDITHAMHIATHSLSTSQTDVTSIITTKMEQTTINEFSDHDATTISDDSERATTEHATDIPQTDHDLKAQQNDLDSSTQSLTVTGLTSGTKQSSGTEPMRITNSMTSGYDARDEISSSTADSQESSTSQNGETTVVDDHESYVTSKPETRTFQMTRGSTISRKNESTTTVINYGTSPIRHTESQTKSYFTENAAGNLGFQSQATTLTSTTQSAEMLKVTTSTSSIVATTTEPVVCGMRFKDKCYTLVAGEMDYYAAKTNCRSVGGKLSDIISRQHYLAVMAYIRKLIPESTNEIDVWTAMTLMITTGKVRLSNWKTATFTSWYPGQPTRRDFNRRYIYLRVPRTKSNKQGMVNYYMVSKLTGALCVTTDNRSGNRR